jgi:hypothetical protein
MGPFRALLCLFLSGLVTMSFVPESLAHSLAHEVGPAAASDAGVDVAGVEAGAVHDDRDHDHDDGHAPEAPCKDGCHSAHCHMKAGPPGASAAPNLDWSRAQLGFGSDALGDDAPEGREPDPERT